jgi:hypothetical protein
MSMAQVAFRRCLRQDRVPARTTDSVAGSGDRTSGPITSRRSRWHRSTSSTVRARHCSRTLTGGEVTSTKDLGDISALATCDASDASVRDCHDAVFRSHLRRWRCRKSRPGCQPMACDAHACGSGLSAAGRISEAYGRRHRRHRCYPWYRPRSPMPRYRGRQCLGQSDRE